VLSLVLALTLLFLLEFGRTEFVPVVGIEVLFSVLGRYILHLIKYQISFRIAIISSCGNYFIAA
jgi:hypothetical protein